MIGRAVAGAARVSLAPLLLRLATGLAGLAALLLAVPAPVRALPLTAVGLAVLAATPAVVPGGRWVTLVALATVAGWLVTTEAYGEPVRLVTVVLLAALLYLLHTLAALAAAVPYDAVVAPDALARWLARALGVIAVSSLLTVLVLAGLPVLAGGTGEVAHVGATLAGLALAGGAAVLLRALTLRRPRTPDPATPSGQL